MAIMHRVRRPSPDTTRNNGQKGVNADVKYNGAVENESPTTRLRLPSEFTDSSRRPSSPLLGSPAFSSTPTDVRRALDPRSERGGTTALCMSAKTALSLPHSPIIALPSRSSPCPSTSGARWLRRKQRPYRPHSLSLQPPLVNSLPSFRTLDSNIQHQPRRRDASIRYFLGSVPWHRSYSY